MSDDRDEKDIPLTSSDRAPGDVGGVPIPGATREERPRQDGSVAGDEPGTAGSGGSGDPNAPDTPVVPPTDVVPGAAAPEPPD